MYNIFGSVSVQGYAGNKVVVETTKTMRAADATIAGNRQEEVSWASLQRNDSVIVYTAGPHDSRPRTTTQLHWNRDEHRLFLCPRLRGESALRQLNLHVSTVNSGKVTVADVAGPLNVDNVNGGISIANARGATEARTVNGNVEASYAPNPAGASSYHTINGKIIGCTTRPTSPPTCISKA